MKASAKHVEVFTFVHRGRTVSVFCADEEEAIRAYEAFVSWWSPGWVWWCVVHNTGSEFNDVFKQDRLFVRTFDTETSAIEYVLDEMDDRSGGGE